MLVSSNRAFLFPCPQDIEEKVERTFKDIATSSRGPWQSHFTMILLTLFAALALILTTAGIYAVISCPAAAQSWTQPE